MIFAYIRVSTDQQTVENQRFEILKFADQKRSMLENGLKRQSVVQKNIKIVNWASSCRVSKKKTF